MNPTLPGELPLLLIPLTEGDQPVPPRAGELPLAEGEDPRTKDLVAPVEMDGVTTLEETSGLLLRLPVLARLPGEELIVEALVNVGEELLTAPTPFAAVATVALLAELDLIIDGELDRIGSRGEVADLVVDVDLGEEEPLVLYDAELGRGLFVEVLTICRGLLEGTEIGSNRGPLVRLNVSGLWLSLLIGLAFRLGATAATSTALAILCYNQT